MDYQDNPSLGMVGGKYSDGDPINNVPGTIIDAAAMNSLFDELINLVEEAGLTPDKNDSTQVHEAVQALIDAKPYLLLAGGDLTGGVGLVKGDDVASTATIDPGADGNFFTVTGTTTITGINTSNPRSPLILRFAEQLTLTNSTSLALPGDIDVLTTAGDVAFFWKIGSNWECLLYMRGDGSVLSQQPLPYRTSAATIENNIAAPNTHLDFVPGAYHSNDGNTISLSTTMTKRLDVVWASGTGNGGRAGDSPVAGATYHCFLIQNDAGAVDAYMDSDLDAGNMPVGYARYAYMGSIVLDSGSTDILGFVQIGSMFWWKEEHTDYSGGNVALFLLAITVPVGLKLEAYGKVRSSAASCFATGAETPAAYSNHSSDIGDLFRAGTNKSGQINVGQSNGYTLTVTTRGYRNIAIEGIGQFRAPV